MEPVKQTFPFKLYHTIEWASDSEFSSALSWSPSGNAFVVHDREVVVEHIIPNFFDHKKWRSFTRQLNLWGFKRELRGPTPRGEILSPILQPREARRAPTDTKDRDQEAFQQEAALFV
ncbi:hypothetical protein QTG54_008019 [Skeletonema marinoi]|uniref:HSF-type DNA-binding domain-containing protein n=1 Tax=Skeletonema marinoi TaxID=267567 RepID=A0AAD8YA26_9STRA|nr:hypothetical protein QTG54_008019 [Skeletonema marinoi]